MCASPRASRGRHHYRLPESTNECEAKSQCAIDDYITQAVLCYHRREAGSGFASKGIEFTS
eukprot:1176255-Prorocentrum_minimum.AAC.2